jgi:hypothetical protein
MSNPSHNTDSQFWQEPDFLLAELVSMLANHLDAEVGITIMVRGAVYSGVLVSEREYLSGVDAFLKQMMRAIVENPSPDDLAAIEDAIQIDEMIEDNYDSDQSDAETVDFDTDEIDPLGIRFLHMRDPVLISPGSTLSFAQSTLPILRVRLTEVDGWMIGRVATMNPYDIEPDDQDKPPRGGYLQ